MNSVYNFIEWIKGEMHELYWKLMHRFHPSHRYNLIHTGLNPGYYDPDQRMLHGCFNLLVEYCKIIGIDDWLDLADDDCPIARNQASVYKQLGELRDWWIYDRPNRKIPGDFCGNCQVTNYKNWCDQCKEYARTANDLEDKWEEEDDQKLIELMKLRRYIWY